MSIYFDRFAKVMDQSDLIQRVCRRSGVPRHANAPERKRIPGELA